MFDKNHDVPYKLITRSKTSKIHQSLIFNVQEWIGVVHPQFYVPHTETRDEEPFEGLNVNIFVVEADYQVDIKLS